MIGRRLGDWSVRKHIANGDTGDVYLATHAKTGRVSAVKVARPNAPGAYDVIKEGEAAAAINHPNVVTVYDVGTDPDGVSYSAMEFLEGKDLRDLLKEQGPLRGGELLKFVKEAAAGLSAVHEKQLLHGDLIPSNMHLATTSDGQRWKLTDFGNSLEIGDLPAEELWTAGYAPPEQMLMRGRSEAVPLNPSLDVFTLGVTTQQAATGRLPFGGDEVGPYASLLTARALGVQTRSPILPSQFGLPSALDPVQLRALEKNPADRIQTASEYAEAFEAGLGKTST